MTKPPKTVLNDTEEFEKAKSAAMLIGALLPSITETPGVATMALMMAASSLALTSRSVNDDIDKATRVLTEALDFVMASHRLRQQREALAAAPIAGMA
ncbi:hypothetical protein [Azospirillum sp. sgz301742]